MIFALKLLPIAINDIQQAYDWYEEQSEGLGERFLDKVEESFEDLKHQPFYQLRYDEVRCLPLTVFPYMIHYKIDEGLAIIYVVAVLHMKKSKKSWFRK